MKKIIMILIAGLLPLTNWAQPTLIKAKRYLDVVSGGYVYPANILIENGKIIAINSNSLPQDAFVIEKPELTVLPGLMDMHVHLIINTIANTALAIVQMDAAKATLNGVNNAHTLLMAGFTTVRNLGQIYPGTTMIDVALAKASEENQIAAPHIIPAGHALSISGGHMDPDMFGQYREGVLSLSYKTGVADGVDEVIKATRYQIKQGAQVIKVAGTAGVLSHEASAGAQQYSYEELKAIVDEAKRHGIFVAVHAHGAEGIKTAIRAGVRSIEHGSLLDDESIQMMKQYGTYLVPTTYVADRIDRDALPLDIRKKADLLLTKAQENIKKAIEAKVLIAFGTDSPVIPHGENAKEFSALVRRGMSPLEAIRSATINSATMMQLDSRGQIKVGLLADLVGVNGDPLTDISTLEQVALVMKSGIIYKNTDDLINKP